MPERTLLYPGQGIKLSGRVREALGQGIHERVTDLERSHGKLFEDIRIWWNWYEAKPRFARKDTPFKDASNVIVPLIQAQSLTLVNRLLGMIFGQGNRIWLARTENTASERTAKNVVRWLNWAADGNDFDFRTPINDWLNELVPIGSSVIALNWRNNVRHVVTGQRGQRLNLRQVNFGRGPLLEHIPREQILWDTQYPVGTAPLVARELHLGWSDLNHAATSPLAAETGWDLDAVASIQESSGLDGPSQTVERSKLDTEGLRALDIEPHDIREVHLDYPALQALQKDADLPKPDEEDLGHPSAGIVVTYHYNTQKVLRVRQAPYNLAYKPFFDGYYRKRPGRSHGVGLCKDLFPMQDAMTVLMNQAIDSRTRANSFWAKTDQRSLVSKVIDPRHPVLVPPGGMFEPMRMEGNILQDTALFNVVNILAERLTGQADPVMGRESRSGGHPSPATSTLALLGQADQMIGSLRMSIRQQVSRMGEAIATLYQQFETNEDGKLERTLGPEDLSEIEDWLFPSEPITGNIIFDVVGMSQNQNPQAEIGRLVQLTQMNQNYWTFIANAFQLQAQAQQQGLQLPPGIIEQSIIAQSKLQERLLEAGDVDDIEQFTIQLRAAARDNQSQLLQAAANAGAAGAGPGAVQQQPVAGPPDTAGGGTLVAPGGFSQ